MQLFACKQYFKNVSSRYSLLCCSLLRLVLVPFCCSVLVARPSNNVAKPGTAKALSCVGGQVSQVYDRLYCGRVGCVGVGVCVRPEPVRPVLDSFCGNAESFASACLFNGGSYGGGARGAAQRVVGRSVSVEVVGTRLAVCASVPAVAEGGRR